MGVWPSQIKIHKSVEYSAKSFWLRCRWLWQADNTIIDNGGMSLTITDNSTWIPHGIPPPIDSHTQFHRASTHPLSTAHNYPTIHASTHTQAAAAHMTCNFWFGNLPQSCGCFCVSSMHLRTCCVWCLCFVCFVGVDNIRVCLYVRVCSLWRREKPILYPG